MENDKDSICPGCETSMKHLGTVRQAKPELGDPMVCMECGSFIKAVVLEPHFRAELMSLEEVANLPDADRMAMQNFRKYAPKIREVIKKRGADVDRQERIIDEMGEHISKSLHKALTNTLGFEPDWALVLATDRDDEGVQRVCTLSNMESEQLIRVMRNVNKGNKVSQKVIEVKQDE